MHKETSPRIEAKQKAAVGQSFPQKTDFRQQDQLLRILPSPPLRTSTHRGWHGIEVQQHRQPGCNTPEHYHTQHAIAIHAPTNSDTHTRRLLDTVRQSEPIVAGTVVIIPSQVTHQVCWAGESDFALILLEPIYLAQAAYEAINVDRVELRPAFALFDPVISQIGALLQVELVSEATHNHLYVDGLTTALSAHLLHQYCTVQHKIRNYAGGLSRDRLQTAINYIQANLAEDLSLGAIAQEVNISQYHFITLFKQSTGMTPHQYVMQQRIERAKELLKGSRIAIADVSLACGFANQSHFTRLFRKHTGATPSAYREH